MLVYQMVSWPNMPGTKTPTGLEQLSSCSPEELEVVDKPNEEAMRRARWAIPPTIQHRNGTRLF